MIYSHYLQRAAGVAAVLACVFVFLFPARSVAALPELTHLAKKASPAVVNISTIKNVAGGPDWEEFFKFHPRSEPFREFFDKFEDFFGEPGQKRQSSSLGSGFIISKDGFIVTNNHVVADADEVKVNLQGQDKESESYDARVVGRDKETDLALIKIDARTDLPVLRFGDSDAMEVGQWVMAIGNPFGLDHSVTVGIVSAKGRFIGSGPFDDYIQTDASINPGNSGGPLLNMDGEVIGVNTAIVATGQGIGFAIPSSMAQDVIDQLKADKKVTRGWIGVTIQDVNADMAKALDLNEPRGALVSAVLEDEPAARAGVKTGDVILSVNGRRVETANGLLRKIAALEPGDTARLTVWRKGREVKLSVTLGERDLSRMAANSREGGGQEPEPQEDGAALGMRLEPVTGDAAAELGMDVLQGVLVSAVEDGSPAANNDVRPGDVILEVNQQQIGAVDDFQEVLESDGRDKGVIMLLISRQGRNVFRTIPLE